MKAIIGLIILLINVWHTTIAAPTNLVNRQLKVDRYTSYQAHATIEEINPLLVVTQINFPSDIKTVSDAIEHSLQRSGYQIDWQQSAEAYDIFSVLEMPIVHRKLNLMTLKDAIATLAGEAWQLLVDSVNRKLVIQLRAQMPWQVAGNVYNNQLSNVSDDAYVPQQVADSASINNSHNPPRRESTSLRRKKLLCLHQPRRTIHNP